MKRGDIVLALFPHASGTPAKRRPALVVQADYYNQRDEVVSPIDISTPDGQRSGLNQSSLVSCLNIGVVPVAVVGPKIGELAALAMVKIDACLKAALEIP
jgi:mRNA interferase MazF